MNLIREYTTTNFDLLDGTLTPTEAIAQLKKNYGVVVDENNKPIALVVAEDLERAANSGASSLLHLKSGLPPTVFVGCEVKMQDLADLAVMTLFKQGARGAIALDNEEKVVGVLPVETFNQYFDSAPDEDSFGLRASNSSGDKHTNPPGGDKHTNQQGGSGGLGGQQSGSGQSSSGQQGGSGKLGGNE